MSLTPSTPDFKANLKTFWQRPEGKTGAVILLATILAGIYGFSMILPWMIALLANTVEAAILAGVLFVLLYTVSSRKFRTIAGNVFQMSMRWLTGIVIQIDPIGILENTLDKMEENLAKLSKAIGSCNGAKMGVQAQIEKNAAIIRKATSIKEQADRQLAAAKDPLMIQRLTLNRQMELQEIGRRMHSNDKLQVILNQTTKLYDLLGRWRNLGEFNVENTKAEIENAKAERETILAAYKGMGFARKLISGDPEQLKMMNQSLEYLAQDNANKLGEMEDFANESQKFLTNMDLESGAAADDAEKMLATYESKLLTAGGQGQPIPVQRVDAVAVGNYSKPVSGDYLDLMK